MASIEEALQARIEDLERRLAEAQAATARAIKTRDDFLSVASHDLRNPLSVILTGSALLLRGEATTPRELKVRRHAEAIQRSATRMNRLVHDLLDLASIQGGRLALDRKSHPVAILLDDAVALMQAKADQKTVALIKGDAPAGLRISCDRGRMVEAVCHLLDNGIKFTEAGGNVSIRVEQADGIVRFIVADTGVGMTPEDLAHAFDRGWQAARKTRDGIGLGLSLAKGIVDTHGGKIRADSVKGAGSTFTFEIPV